VNAEGEAERFFKKHIHGKVPLYQVNFPANKYALIHIFNLK
jgi:hypothetical protein